MKSERPKILLIIAPSLFECYHAARAHGLEPGRMQNFRNITKATDLRGVRKNDAFVDDAFFVHQREVERDVFVGLRACGETGARGGDRILPGTLNACQRPDRE